ncbi:MAG: Flp pilus assembly complex ATPase component TadA [Planctomycetes bacterium]|nr:Flp pilus assembly complex ATPase component TadA [Planctomycetota bacterium]
MNERKLLGQILKEMELVNTSQIQEALEIQRKEGGLIGEILVKLKYVTKDDILLALAAQHNMEYVNLDETFPTEEALEKVSKHIAKTYNVIPLSVDDDTITIATADPTDLRVFDDLKMTLRSKVQLALASPDSLRRALDRYYDTKLVVHLSEDDKKINIEFQTKGVKSGYNIEDVVNAAPVIKLLNFILLTAIKAKASDIHFEPFEGTFKVRYRVDGILYEMESPPTNLAMPLITRIKVLANLDIAETRLPQDGRIMLTVSSKPVDLRVSTLPTIFGESVVLRVLDRSVVNLNLENLGIRDSDLQLITKLISIPHGIIIVTGPTGSGKTTTLYSCLNYLNGEDVKIITTEDPVEYDIDGIIQCPVNDDISVTYAALLRTILRQDPDIILVGEIRDLETARTAIEASLTGHLVFSTLHTNDAPSAITRLIDLGVEPYLICATLEAIVAQRLVRKICVHCKDEFMPTQEMLFELGLTQTDIKNKKFYWGKGCSECNNTGYRGRTAIYEIMLLSEPLKELVLKNSSTEQIRIKAKEEGLKTLRESGILEIFDGRTTIEEVVRETLMQET